MNRPASHIWPTVTAFLFFVFFVSYHLPIGRLDIVNYVLNLDFSEACYKNNPGTTDRNFRIMSKQDACRKNVFFDRPHKTGSTSVASSLWKIAGIYGAVIIPGSDLESKTNLPDQNPSIPHFFLEHNQVQNCQVRDVFKPEESFFIRNVREPISRFKSDVQFKQRSERYIQKKLDDMRKYNAGNYSRNYLPSRLLCDTQGGWYTVCQETMDSINLKDNFFYSEDQMYQWLNSYDVIIPTDELSAGFAVLSKLLCRPLEDFTTVRLKEASKKFYKYTEEDERTMKTFFRDDTYVYQIVKERFKQQIEALGRTEILADAKKLSAMNSDLAIYCGYKQKPTRKVHIPMFTLDIKGMLLDDQKLLRCIHLLFDPKNGVYESVIPTLRKAFSSGEYDVGIYLHKLRKTLSQYDSNTAFY